ncbi:Rrp15p-domain-containing protein [Flagelloscypha sp. PMI_526]|nr:Rrp15p-domain-containing protein [Flagelloscypha sp. PMI_526]
MNQEQSSLIADSPSEPDTDEEIHNMKLKKSQQTSKRKLRATNASNFGVTLQALLDTKAPSSTPLSLKPSVAKHDRAEKLEKQAKRKERSERRDHEEVGRIKDVIGGWGGESERELRKVAQRGVVKLFNVIQQAQAADTAISDKAKASRGSGKPSLPAPSTKSRPVESANLSKNDFFNMLKAGSIVSKT